MVAGIVVGSVGAIGMIAGLSMASAAEDQNCDGILDRTCDEVDEDKRTAGIVTALVGLGLVGAGLPLIIVGARKVPVEDGSPTAPPPETALWPTLTVGLAGADLTWQF